MKMTKTMTLLVLITALLMAATATRAQQEYRIWAPTGDLVGQENHGTVTMGVLDDYGFGPKYAEDWQLSNKFNGSLLQSWHTIGENSQLMSLRSYGRTALDGRLNGHATYNTAQPGKWAFNLDYRGAHHGYDTTSELRALSFAATPPSMLAEVPVLNWSRYRMDGMFKRCAPGRMRAGLDYFQRSGEKSSLLWGHTQPSVNYLNTRSRGFWMSPALGYGALQANLNFNFRENKGTRVSNETYGDDYQVWNLGLNASYALNPRLRLMGGGLVGRLAGDQTQTAGADNLLTQNEAKITAGQLGVLARVTRCTTVKLTGQFKKQDSEAQVYDALVGDRAMERDRKSTVLRFKAQSQPVKQARVQAYFKYDKSDLDETVGEGGLIDDASALQTAEQERTRNSAGLKLKYRFSKKMCLRGGLGWQKTEITETTAGDDLVFKMGDRNLDQLKWQLALHYRPLADLKLKVGHQTVDQTYERVDEATETTWSSQSGFATANWMVTPKLSVLATVSLGMEKYELTDGPAAGPGMSPLTYDGTTLRYAPAVVYSFNDKLTLEAVYEGVNFEDTGDSAATVLKSDTSHLLARVGYDVSERARLSASFRRCELDENRWDDYILDIYSLSLTGRF
jgi:hypothetical protein